MDCQFSLPNEQMSKCLFVEYVLDDVTRSIHQYIIYVIVFQFLFFRRSVIFWVGWSESQLKSALISAINCDDMGHVCDLKASKSKGSESESCSSFPKHDLSNFVGSVTRHLNDAVSANSTPPKTNNDPKHELK